MQSSSKGVKKWGKHFYVFKGQNEGKEVTHLCLDGGKLHVPDDKLDFFHRKLAVDIAQGTRNYVVERRTPVFKFHADLDIFEPSVPEYDRILGWIRNDILDVLRQFYPLNANTNSIERDRQLTVIVCTTEAKTRVEKYGKMYDKVGIHLLFPWLYVDT